MYKQFLYELASQCGQMALAYFNSPPEKSWKDGTHLVTEADKAINTHVIEQVSKTYPEHRILGEEESHGNSDSEFCWVVDPIDGTIPFAHAIPTWAISIALVHNGTTIAGAISDPVLDRMIVAERGKGAHFYGQKPEEVQVSDAVSLEHQFVNVESWSTAPFPLPDLKSNLVQANALPININSITYGYMLVALGKIAGSVFPGKNPWDSAAADVIITEAGGRITDLYGNTQRYDQDITGCVVSNGRVHEQLLETISQNRS